jgi:hypothetical protein
MKLQVREIKFIPLLKDFNNLGIPLFISRENDDGRNLKIGFLDEKALLRYRKWSKNSREQNRFPSADFYVFKEDFQNLFRINNILSLIPNPNNRIFRNIVEYIKDLPKNYLLDEFN